MSNYILEEKIKNLSTQFIEQKAIASFLLLLNSILEKEEQEEIHYTIHDDIFALQSKIKQYILDLESILEDKKEVRLAALEDCIQLKKNLISIYESVHQYISIWNLHFTRINDEIAIRKYKEEKIVQENDINWNAFYADCIDFFETSSNALEQKTRMADILKCLPFRMAREKYYDILKKNMEYSFYEQSEKIIERSFTIFRYIIMPEKNKNLNKYFTEIPEWIISQSNIVPSELSNEELEQKYDDFDTVFKELEKIEDMFRRFLDDINSLIILFYLGYSFTELTEKNVSHADFYYTICEMFTGELSETEKEAYLERLNTSLENEISSVLDQGNDIAKQEIKYLKKINDFSELSEDTRKILLTEDFVRNCYFDSLDEALFQFDISKELPPASEEWKQKVFDDFIADVRESFSTLSMPIRKALMQLLLGVFPPVFTVEEMLSMIETAIKEAASFEHRLLIVDKMGMIFESYGFHDNDKPEHHHHHDHCDCGHHHH